ncbi:MAG: hypothetical protein K0Q79_819 [Flavipsychrobacter sp.]|jgi:class 3 adenylate cyclase|nr:hypothetical protein [Flavipsychrobacter sp.]
MKCFFLIPVILLLAYSSVFAKKSGQERIDSLLGEVSNKRDDTSQVKLLSDLAAAYSVINPDEGIKYGEQSLALAGKCNWKKGQAMANIDIGLNYRTKADFQKALQHYQNALKISEEAGLKKTVATALGNIGIINSETGNYPGALEYYFKALKIHEELNDRMGMARNFGNIGNIYSKQKNSSKALEYDFKALKICEELNLKKGIVVNLNNIGNEYADMGDIPKKLEYSFKALKIAEEIQDKYEIQKIYCSIGIVYYRMGKYPDALENSLKALKTSEEIHDKYSIAYNIAQIGCVYSDIAKNLQREKQKGNFKSFSKDELLHKATVWVDSSVKLFKEIGNVSALLYAIENLSEIQRESGNYKGALESYHKYVFYKDSLFSLENNEKITNLETKRELDLKDKVIEINRLKVIQKRKTNIYLSCGIALLLVVVGFVVKERKKSDKLLLNILPEKVADELKKKGSSAASHFDAVTVIFADFVNFTKASERMSPQELVNELDACFRVFDKITSDNHIEKIKTVGDAYLAVSGLPKPNAGHAVNMIKAAKEIMAFMMDRRAKIGDRTFEIRIGIHSGTVVAGIVGIKKFAYDIWGDTVNIAARMEQTSEPGKINISQSTFDLVKDKFSCTYRGEIDAKNKGGMNMYFVD